MQKGRHISEETRTKLSKAMTGRSSNRKGVRLSQQIRARMSEGQKRRFLLHPELREYCRQRMIGHTLSDSGRKKISLAMKGRICSKEHRQKLSASVKKTFQEHNMGDRISERAKGNQHAKGHVVSIATRRMWSKNRAEAVRSGLVHAPNSDINGWFISKKNGRFLHYRSHLELGWYKMMEKDSSVLRYEVESVIISYRWRNFVHRYVPDVLLYLRGGSRCLLEIKPEKSWTESQNEVKWNAAKKWCKYQEIPTSFRVVGYNGLKVGMVKI